MVSLWQARYRIGNTTSHAAQAINMGNIMEAPPQQGSGGGGTSSQAGQLGPPNLAPAFPQFKTLPTELQDMIWEEAYDALRNSPDFVSFRVDIIQRNDQWDRDIICFTPDSQTAESTSDQRGLLGACRQARRKALQSLAVVTLFRLNGSTGSATEYRIPFNGEKTGFYIYGNIKPSLFQCKMDFGRARGFAVAKHVRRLAFLFDSNNTTDSLSDMTEELSEFTHMFHNAEQIGSISLDYLYPREKIGEESFKAVIKFQQVSQKTMVGGLPYTIPAGQRSTMLRHALRTSFEDWWVRAEAVRVRAAREKRERAANAGTSTD